MLSKTKYVIMAIYDDRIELLEFSYGVKNIIVHNFGKVALPSKIVDKGRVIDDHLLEAKIQEVLAKAVPKAVESKNLILIINNDLIFNHVFNFDDKLLEDYLVSIIPNEAEKIIPFNRDDIYWDFRVMCNDTEKKNTVVQYYAASKEAIEKYLAIINRLKLTPVLITGRYEAYKVLLHDDEVEKKEKLLVLELNKHSIKLITIVCNVIVDIKIFDFDYEKFLSEVGANISIELQGDNIKNVDYLDQILQNINLEIAKIDGLPKEYSIYVWGEKLVDAYLFDYINAHFKNLKVKSIWNPVKLGLEFKHKAEAVEFVNNNKIDFGILAAISAVFGLHDAKELLNLLPFNLRSARTISAVSRFLNLAGSLTIALNLSVIFLMLFYALTFQFDLRELSQETRNFEKLIYGKKYEQLKTDILNFNLEVDKLYNLSGKIVDLPLVYRDVIAFSNKDISLGSLRYSKELKMLEIDGQSLTRKSLIDFKDEISKLKGIDKVDFPLANLDKSENITFTIKIFLTDTK